MIRNEITDWQEEDLRREMKKHGYELYKITHFKNHDRITFGNKGVKISINMRGFLSNYTLETIIKACIR